MSVIAKNMLAMLGSQVATWILTSFMLIIVPRYLGDRQFGEFSVASSLVGFFGLFVGLSSGQFVVKQVARDPARVGPYVFNALLMTVALALPLSGAAIGTAYLLGFTPRTIAIVVVGCVGMALGALNAAFVMGLQGQQRMQRAALWATVDRYISGAGVWAALVTGSGLVVVAMATYWSTWASLIGNGARLLREMRDGARLDLRLWRVLAVGGAPFMVWGIVLTIYGSIDTVMLSKMSGDAVVGWYALAYRLVGIPIFMASIVVTAYFPQLSAHAASRSPMFASLTNQAVRLVFFVGLPAAAGIALIASDLITLLHYPSGFTHTIPLVWILACHIPIVGVTTVLGAALMACDRQKAWVLVGACAAVFNPLLNLFAIPAANRTFGNGAVGASVVTVATECLMLTGALYLSRSRGIPNRYTLGFLARCIVACAIMAGIVLACRSMWLPVRIVIGMITYGLVSLMMGTLPVREIHSKFLQIRTHASSRSAPGVPLQQ